MKLKLTIKLQELEEYERNGDVKLNVAFSRDQEKKVYVTHLLENNMDELWDIIGNRNGHFYICGYVNYKSFFCCLL